MLFDYFIVAPKSWIKCFSEVFADKMVFIKPIFEFGEVNLMVVSELRVDLRNELVSEIKVLIFETLPREGNISNAVYY